MDDIYLNMIFKIIKKKKLRAPVGVKETWVGSGNLHCTCSWSLEWEGLDPGIISCCQGSGTFQSFSDLAKA